MDYARARALMESKILADAASAEYGDQTLQRVSELNLQRAISADEVDRVRSEAKIAYHRLQASHEEKRLAELEYRRAEEVLKQHTIRSPIDGVIAERYLDPGESVENQPLLRIAQIDPLRVELILPAEQYGAVRLGDKGRVRIHGATSQAYQAQVISIDPIIDPASATFRVTLELPNPNRTLTSGLRCQVDFSQFAQTDEQDIDAEPAAAEVGAETPGEPFSQR